MEGNGIGLWEPMDLPCSYTRTAPPESHCNWNTALTGGQPVYCCDPPGVCCSQPCCNDPWSDCGGHCHDGDVEGCDEITGNYYPEPPRYHVFIESHGW